MQLEVRKLLEDLRRAAMMIERFTAGRSLKEYQTDDLLRSAVERQFEIIGEAINRLSKLDPPTSARIQGYQRIIAFRNVLIHGYDAIDDRVVWEAVQDKLPILHRQVDVLMREPEEA